jgi:ligand-binding sensor domain-containing protein/two-component sensor histidine kinase
LNRGNRFLQASKAKGWRASHGLLLILLALLVTFSNRTAAQRLPLKTYTTADGLWNSAVYYIMKDSHQFLWFCTSDGLSRFDGSRFVNYKLPTASPRQQVFYMLETHEGSYWIIAGGGRLYHYDPHSAPAMDSGRDRVPDADGRFLLAAQPMLDKSFATEFFVALYEDSSGHLWAGGSSGLALIEKHNGVFERQPVSLNLPPELRGGTHVSVIREGKDGSLWLGTEFGLLRLTRDHHHTIRYAFNPDYFESVTSLLPDKEGRVWVGRRSGLLVFTPGPSTLPDSASSFGFTSQRVSIHKPVIQDDRVLLPEKENEATDCTSIAGDFKKAFVEHTIGAVSGIYEHSNGWIWAIVNEQIVFYANGRFHEYTRFYPADLRFPFSEDADGNLWIASPSGSIRVSARGFNTYDNTFGLKKGNIHGIFEDNAGSLYVVTGKEENLWINRLSEGRLIPIHPKVKGAGVTAFLDRKGDWWIPADRGLYRYHFSPGDQFEDLGHMSPLAVYTQSDGLSSRSTYNFQGNNAYHLFEDSKGDLWISTRDLHLVHWQRSTETFYTFTEADGWLPEMGNAFAEDKAGNLWFGSTTGDLVRYRQGEFMRLTQKDDAPGVQVNGLYIDHGGRLWVASDSRLIRRVDDPTAEHPRIIRYAEEPGLSHTATTSIIEDLEGNMYVGTSGRGIDRLTPKTGDVLHYNVTDSLATEFIAYALRDHNGKLWFATTNGLSQLDPQAYDMRGQSVTIVGLRISGSDYPIAQTGSSEVGPLELSATENSLEVNFASIGHSRPQLYQYKFDGRDKDWTTINQPTVRYEQLAPGEYRLFLRVQGMDAIPPAIVTFKILSPLWRRWWFLTLMAALMISIAIVWHRYRVSHLLALERVRTHIASELHDDIGSSLSQIAILSEVARLEPAPKQGMLSEIAAISRELVDSMSDIVWTIKPENDHLSNLVSRMRRFATDVLAGRNIALQFHSAIEDQDLRTSTEIRREIYLIFKEAVSNVARHSGARQAKIELELVKDELILRVSDNGNGFDPAAGNGGNGLVHMRKRAAELKGVCQIWSSPGAGTIITLKVPWAPTKALAKLIGQ